MLYRQDFGRRVRGMVGGRLDAAGDPLGRGALLFDRQHNGGFYDSIGISPDLFGQWNFFWENVRARFNAR